MGGKAGSARGGDTYVALLRGINVGGHNKVAMTDLRALLEALGLSGVRTYIQSGNAVFTAAGTSAAQLEARIAAALRERLGVAAAVMVRTRDELRAVLADNPFIAEGLDPARLSVAFLDAAPPAEAVASLDAARVLPDRFAVRGRTTYLYTPNGLGRTKLTPSFWKPLGGSATVRNWRTVNQLLAMMTGS